MNDGKCGCGCGEQTTVHRGVPRLFIHGHNPIKNPEWADDQWEIQDRGYATPCWIWVGPLTVDGYGLIRNTGSNGARAHAESYIRNVGTIPDGLEIDHLCSVHSCVRPDHLEAVTHAENVRRAATLSWKIVREIRERYTGLYGEQSTLAREYGVSPAAIHNIVRGKTWA